MKIAAPYGTLACVVPGIKPSNLESPASVPPPSVPRSGFWALFFVQFQNAFSDNALKFLATFIIIGLGIPHEERDRLVPLVGVIFALPFVLFSMTGGFFADRFCKRNVIVGIKLAEIGIMSLATFGLWQHNVAVLMAVIFLMSTHSAFFGPSKYGLLPEILAEKELSWGNGIISLGTFITSIAGTVAAGFFSDTFGKNKSCRDWL